MSNEHFNSQLTHIRYFKDLEDDFNRAYEIAVSARSKGYDPSNKPEAHVARDLAERVEKSVGPPGVGDRIRELSEEMPREDVAFKIAEEIAYGKYGHEGEAAAEQAVRTALAILDEGVTAAPLQGIVDVVEKMNPDRTRYLAIYFAGPIRSAGGTEMALTLIVADFIRQILGLSRYKATKEEAKRFVEELRTYERTVARFQYKLSDEELFNAIINLPVEVTGIETDPVEVPSFRNLKRIETNRVRGGALRVVNDGLIGRSNKVIKLVEKLGISGWSWLKEITPANSSKGNRHLMFLEDVIAGRPIFSFPSAIGGFRLRYGRCRNTGLASIGVHPATMRILKDFIATGTQLRIEAPGKAGTVVPVDTIEPPIVRLKDGTVLRVTDPKYVEGLSSPIESILFLGDLLIGFGEFVENNHPLLPSGYVEEWWITHLKAALSSENIDLNDLASETGIPKNRLKKLIKNPLRYKPTAQEALSISKRLDVPLHPSHTYFWETLTINELMKLKDALKHQKEAANSTQDKITTPFNPEVKSILEKLCLPHRVLASTIEVVGDEAIILKALLPSNPRPMGEESSTLELLEKLSGIKVYAKGVTYIGARMGRPEKAKERQMKPLVHCLFPVGLTGGPRRNIVEAAMKAKMVTVELSSRRCPSCGHVTYKNLCPKCGATTTSNTICPRCKRPLNGERCPTCKVYGVSYNKTIINLEAILKEAIKRLGLNTPPELVKGVKGLSNDGRIPEPLEKGILRAEYGLSVFKDGTVRFDATNASLTHFKPAEIKVDLDKIKSLGYLYDWKGEELNDPNQLCTLKVQDVILPEKCGDYLVKVAQFIDDLLTKFYGLQPFYNVDSRSDLVGHLIVGLSPHTSVGVLGRIIGFTKANVCFAHPFWHASKRRDCDGDEDSVSLLMDILINFSKAFLPSKIGGMMDAPLLLTLNITPTEVARQAFNIETIPQLPMVLFEESWMRSDSKRLSDAIELVLHRLGTKLELEPISFTHTTEDINEGNHESMYVKLSSMLEKVRGQLNLAEEIKAVQVDEVAKKVVSTHFMRDLTGNLKAYAAQKARCKRCNAKYRRVPLSGRCHKCGGEISLTVYKGSVEKYLEVAKEIVDKYNVGKYYQQRLHLIEEEITHLFPIEAEKDQRGLADFM